MGRSTHTFQLQRLLENIDKLSQEAESGSFEATQRLESIRKLADPIFDFSHSDYRRILDKQLPLPVRKGIELYKMMNQLTYLVQPVGNRKGTACSVHRVDYENLTWEEFLNLRGNFSAGFFTEAIRQRAEPTFEGLRMLNDRQKELYQRIKVYFGKRKRPTLQSLAMSLLSEESNGKEFSERSLYVYLEAISAYQKKRKKAAGFDVFYFTFHSVTSFGSGRTVRESLESWDRSLAQFRVAVGQSFAEIGARQLQLMMPTIGQVIASQLRLPISKELFRATIPNLSKLLVLSGEDNQGK